MKKRSTITLIAVLLLLAFAIPGQLGLRASVAAASTRNDNELAEGAGRAQTGAAQSVAQRIRVESIPPAVILALPIKGSFDQHPQMIQKLMSYALANYTVVGTVMGIYPDDPDALSVPFPKELQTNAPPPTQAPSGNPANLGWEIAVRVVPGAPSPIQSQTHYATLGLDSFTVNASDTALNQPISSFRAPDPPFILRLLPGSMALVLDTTVEMSLLDGDAMFPWMTQNGYVKIGATRMEYGVAQVAAAKVPTRIYIPIQKRPSGVTAN